MDLGRSEPPPEIVETAGVPNLKYRGRLLYSERGPLFSAQRGAAAAERGPARLYLVPSPALWYGIEELLACLERGSAVLCVEAEDALFDMELQQMPAALRALLQQDENSFFKSRLAFIKASSPGDIESAAEKMEQSLSCSFRRCVLLHLSGGGYFHSELYRDAAARLNSAFESHWRSKAALLSMGRLWARNIFRNLAALPFVAPEPIPRFGPCIVCGAGPSLERSLPFIREQQKAGSLSVIACDTALSPLLDSGILPDLLVCLEGQAYNLADFTALGAGHIHLIADLSSHPCTFTAPQGTKYLSLVRIIDSGFLNRISALVSDLYPGFIDCPPLGSVGVHAAHIARSISDGPIFLTGLDFSYEPGKTHARGSPSLRSALNSQNRLSRWPGQLSSTMRAFDSPLGPYSRAHGIVTDPGLASYAALLADEIQKPGPAVYDLRGGGLPLAISALSFDAAINLLVAARHSSSAAQQTVLLHAGASEESSLELNMDSSQKARTAARRIDATAFFIEAEIKKLENMEASLKGRRAFDRGQFAADILTSDYIIWSFPDSTRLFELPQDMLNRILVEIEYWLWKLRQIRGICARRI